jgi:hypothetical protein
MNTQRYAFVLSKDFICITVLNVTELNFFTFHDRILTHIVGQARVRDHHIHQGLTEILEVLEETLTGEPTDLKA